MTSLTCNRSWGTPTSPSFHHAGRCCLSNQAPVPQTEASWPAALFAADLTAYHLAMGNGRLGIRDREGAGAAVEEQRGTVRRRRSRSNLVSAFFGVLAVVLAAVAGVLYFSEQNGVVEAPTPRPAVPGRNEMIHVLEALSGQGLETSFAQGGVPAGELGVPGQTLTVDGSPLFVFVFPSVERAEAAAAVARDDPSALLAGASFQGTPVATNDPHIASHSNIVVALIDGTEELAAGVDRAIGGLA